MKLVPDGYGEYKYIDLHPGDIISDGLGGYKIYDPEEKPTRTIITTNTYSLKKENKSYEY